MSKVYVVGVGMTPFGRFLDRSLRDLAVGAASAALEDGGCAAGRVDSVFFANSAQGVMEGQHSIRGEIALLPLALGNVPVVNVENACASASTAFNMALTHIRAGMSDIALAVGAEKMYSADRARSFSIFEGSWDVHAVEQTVRNLMYMGEGVPTPDEYLDTGPHSVFMDVYQAFTKFHMRTFGTTPRQIAAVAAKNHRHSMQNPLAQYRRDYSIEEVLAAPMIAWPLTLPMCSPISDGAAAALLCSEAGLRRLGGGAACEVRASVLMGGGRRGAEEYRLEVSHLAAKRAYELAGVGPEDIDVVEVHDATAFGEIQQTENLLLCDFGGGGPLAESGATSLGGRVPVNPSGGLESKGHPIGATGLAQIYELVMQLRGRAGPRQVEGARVAIAENGGGLIGAESGAVVVTILGR
ncbi:MAG: thiolase family protein [Rhodocyclaceae bacterium]|nr:thiolase family protein [Rhodocyclaceae bacterium]